MASGSKRRDRRFWMWWDARKMGIALAALGLLVAVLGHLDQYGVGTFSLRQLFTNLYANLGSEMIGIAITVLLIDTLNQRREELREKERLIQYVSSPHNVIALQAVEELRAQGWLEDGSLEGMNLWGGNLQSAELFGARLRDVDLGGANLEGANLSGADLRGADLGMTNLQGADLIDAKLQEARLTSAKLQGTLVTDAQLAQADGLRGAIMPNGGRYDGRFNLPGDLRQAREVGVATDNPSAMADFYGVSQEDYQHGHVWAEENLLRLQGRPIG